MTTGIRWPMLNAAVAGHAAEREALGEVLARLNAGGEPWFCFQLHSSSAHVAEELERSGARPFDDRSPWMEAPTSALPEPGAVEGIEVAEAVDEPAFRRWAAAVREVYGFPPQGEEAWTELVGRFDWRPPWRCWTAMRAGRAVGTTQLAEANGVAALFAVGVIPEERRRGLGALLTLLPLKQATPQVAGFWPTPMSHSLYLKLGFSENGWARRWLGGPDPGDLGATRGGSS